MAEIYTPPPDESLPRITREWATPRSINGRNFTAESTYISEDGICYRDVDFHPKVPREEFPLLSFSIALNEDTGMPFSFRFKTPNFYSRERPHETRDGLMQDVEAILQERDELPKDYQKAKELVTGTATAGADVTIKLDGTSMGFVSRLESGKTRWSFTLDADAMMFRCDVPEGGYNAENDTRPMWARDKDVSQVAVLAVLSVLMRTCIVDEDS